MIIGNRTKLENFKDMQLLVEQDILENVTEFKYLGIIINQHLTWHDHVEIAAVKGFATTRSFKTDKARIAFLCKETIC